MADFTLSSGSVCRPYRSPWGAFPTRGLPCSSGISSNAIRIGSIMRLDDRVSTQAHRVAPTSTSGDTLIVGISAMALSGSTVVQDTTVNIWDANPMVEFKAVTKGATLLSTQVGSQRTLAWDSTLNIAYVDLGASTAGDERVLVTQLIDAVGDSGGYVAFRFAVQERISTNNSSVAYLGLYGR